MSVDVRKSVQKLCVHVCVYSWDRKQMLKRKREKSQRESKQQTAHSWEATNHTQ